MAARSRAREVALQLLFQYDQNPVKVARRPIERFAADRLTGNRELMVFCLDLYDGVQKHRAGLDERLAATAENWKLHRMAAVDRNVLRLGAFELLHSPEQPPVEVVIDEAVELARRYGSKDSPAFVNGILDKIARMRSAELGMRNTEPSPAATSIPG
jgi:N utilization substance protein B